MICSRAARRLAPLVVALSLALPGFSGADEVVPSTYKYASMSTGLRSSFTAGGAGLDFRLGIGGYWGLLGVELETGWTADKSWMAPEYRNMARTTTWLGPQLWLRPTDGFALSFGVSPGLGWIKDPADTTEPHPRHASGGIREYVQAGFFVGAPHGLFQIALRVEFQHLAQSAIVDGTEHAFCLRLVMALGEVRSIEELRSRERPRWRRKKIPVSWVGSREPTVGGGSTEGTCGDDHSCP